MLWLIIVNIGLILYWQQVGMPALDWRYESLCIILGLLNAAMLGLRELGLIRGLLWLNGSWLRWKLILAVLIPLSLPVLHLVFEFEDADVMRLLSASVWLFAAAGIYLAYRFTCQDMPSLSILVMNICAMIVAVIGRLWFQNEWFVEEFQALLFAFVILGVVSVAVRWLRYLAATMEAQREPDTQEAAS